MADYALPKDTQAAFQRGQSSCFNLGLLFERYTPFGQGWALEGQNKYKAFDEVVKAAERAQREPGYHQLIQQHHRRWRDAAKAAGAPDDCIFEASPEWRFVVGLGRESVLETGFTFHRLYGFPYLPGSALKGLTQACALWWVAERLGVPAVLPGQNRPGQKTPIQQLEVLLTEPDGSKRREHLDQLRADIGIPPAARLKTAELDEMLCALNEDADRYQAVFGTVGAPGRVVFFDAVPVEPPRLKVDVMNPHYGDYYQKPDVPPADYLSPAPVYFLTVEAGSRFAFAVVSRHADQARQAADWLVSALRDLGAGAKTSAGYGYFIVSDR